jgi:hypothetical protein
VKSEYLIINATYDDKSESLKAEIYVIVDKNIDPGANLTAAVAATTN